MVGNDSNSNDEWKVVVKKQSKNKSSKSKASSKLTQNISYRSFESESFQGKLKYSPNSSCVGDLENEEIEKILIEQLESSRSAMKSSLFYKNFVDQFNQLDVRQRLNVSEFEKVEIVVYGIGSILNSKVSNSQFSLVHLLSEMMAGNNKIYVFDPVLTNIEKSILQNRGCKIIQENEAGHRCISLPTIFFMPHCETQLYENVIMSNYENNKLNKMILIGNSFLTYKERFSLPNTLEKPEFLLRSISFLNEFPINPSNFYLISAFNDMSWHFFSKT